MFFTMEMSLIRFLYLFVLLKSISLLTTKAQDIGSNCKLKNGHDGECRELTNCAPLEGFFRITQLKFCNLATSVVCCPTKITILSKIGVDDDQSKIYARECFNFSRQAYPDCDPTPLIVNGVKAAPKEFPFMARLGRRNSDGSTKWECGGALISQRYVLTAAHCFDEAKDKIINIVRLGDTDFSTDADTGIMPPQEIAIKYWIQHPSYTAYSKYDDIALLELATPATINSFVVPICLPFSNGTEYKKFIAAGWGLTEKKKESDQLLKVQLERFEDDICSFHNTPTDSLPNGYNNRTQICAGSYTDRSDTGTGDSGGPLFIQHPKYRCMYSIIGITSFGFGFGIPTVPAVYTRVNLFVDWIEKIAWNKTAEFFINRR